MITCVRSALQSSPWMLQHWLCWDQTSLMMYCSKQSWTHLASVLSTHFTSLASILLVAHLCTRAWVDVIPWKSCSFTTMNSLTDPVVKGQRTWHAGNFWRKRRKSVSCHCLTLIPKLCALKEKNSLCTVSHMGSRQLLLCLLCPSAHSSCQSCMLTEMLIAHPQGIHRPQLRVNHFKKSFCCLSVQYWNRLRFLMLSFKHLTIHMQTVFSA